MKSMNLMKWLLCYVTKFGMVCSLAIVTKSELFLKFSKHPQVLHGIVNELWGRKKVNN